MRPLSRRSSSPRLWEDERVNGGRLGGCPVRLGYISEDELTAVLSMKEQIGLNFATALRAFLRQDPNIILVGEIRDLETAEIAIKASLTGHLVLSTLHTNDAPATVSRLMNMGIEPFLVATSVQAICSQRLVRRVCVDCREEARLAGNARCTTPGWSWTGENGFCA